ncbi:MAG TPA: thioredoxin family protein [Actinomycetes bacterium]|nr:thioredoxin family protein [Actinomycetes bacterium]
MEPVGAVVLGAVLLAATAFGLYRRRTDGRVRPVTVAADGQHITSDDLGVPLGASATLVQFSSAFCQPCRATRQLLGEVAGMVDGVVHVDVDAESQLDLVRRLDVMRTPTVFVLDSDGRVVRRAAGVPAKADVIAAIGQVV